MSLSNTAILKAKPSDKAFKMFDSGGLYLLVNPTGSKLWRFKYKYDGKEKLLCMGKYPEKSLLDIREEHAKARKLLAEGIDPGEVKKAKRQNLHYESKNSFEAIAREWHGNRIPGWSERYAGEVLKRLEADIFPRMGKRHIAAIKAPELLETLRLIEKRQALEMARRILQYCSHIFLYGIATGKVERNPAADLRGALKTPQKKHYAHLKPVEFPEFLQRLEAYDGALLTKLAIELLSLTFVRTIELRAAKWVEFDLQKAEWRIPSERMKMKGRKEHIVPLSKQAIEVLKKIKKISGHGEYLFPHQFKPDKFMSENTILFALYRMGYHSKATGHGFRHTASTVLNENNFSPDIIERQLAHIERNKVRGTYNHAEYLPERRKMMQWWADYLTLHSPAT